MGVGPTFTALVASGLSINAVSPEPKTPIEAPNFDGIISAGFRADDGEYSDDIYNSMAISGRLGIGISKDQAIIYGGPAYQLRTGYGLFGTSLNIGKSPETDRKLLGGDIMAGFANWPGSSGGGGFVRLGVERYFGGDLSQQPSETTVKVQLGVIGILDVFFLN